VADAKILTTTWKPKNTNLLLRQQWRHLVWHACSFRWVFTLNSERSYFCVSRCYLRTVF